MGRPVAAIALLALAGGCAGIPGAPPLGPDVYRCTGRTGDMRFLRINPNTFQVWFEGAWQENACTQPGESCTVDSDGRINVRRVVQMENMPRIDILFVYDLAAGIETQTSTFNGKTTEPSTAACAPLV